MLGRALQEASLVGELVEEDLYNLGDETLLAKLSTSRNPVSASLAQALLARRLHKGLLKYSIADFEGLQEHDHIENAIDTACQRLAQPISRKSLEDQLAAEIGAEPGDVILYAPDQKMNLKAAKMKVLWQGAPKCLKDIDDKIIKPKLDVILEAHRMLWGLHVIVSPSLNERQKDLLSTACEIEFLSPHDKRDAKKHKYYEDLVETHLAKKDMETLFRSTEFLKRRSDAASQLVAAANDNRPWVKRIDDVVTQFFGERKVNG